MKTEDVEKTLPKDVVERFKALNERCSSGERKRWVVPNNNDDFDPLTNDYKEKIQATLESPTAKMLSDIINKNV